MTDFLKKYGPAAIRNGWPIVLLGHKSKKPIGDKWQKHDTTLEEVQRAIQSGKHYGFGIRCGNIVGIDDDYEESEVVTEQFLEDVEELKNHYFPKSLLRRGRPSRPPLRVIRLANGDIAKSCNIDKLQVIGAGRQFVAYNIHPETEEPYAWNKTRGVGSPNSLSVAKIPTYSKADLEAFLEAMQLLEEVHGLAPENSKGFMRQVKSGEKLKSTRPLHADRRSVEKACDYIVNEEKWGWEDWNNNIMMPLFNASKGEEWGRELAHKLSAQHADYSDDETDKKWEQLQRSPPAVLGWPHLHWLARQGGMPFLGPLDWDNYRYFRDRTEIYDVRADAWITRISFDDMFTRQKAKGHKSCIQTFVESRADQCFYSLTWDPSLPEGEAVVQDKRVWNLWKQPDWFGEKGDVKPWLAHVERIYGDEADLVVKRMAFDIQYIHLRPQWHLLTIGSHGIGKNTLIMPLVEWANRFHLWQSVSFDSLNSTFNEYLNKTKILTANDITHVHDHKFNKMKDMLAGTEHLIRINEKYTRPFYVRNIGSWYLSSNAEDPVSISRSERRLLVANSLATTPISEKEKDKAKSLFNWVTANQGAIIHYLKHEVEVKADFGSVLPRRTQAQLDLADMTAPMYESIANMLPGIINGSPLFTIQGLMEKLLNSGDSIDVRHLNNKSISKALHHIKAMKCNKGEQIRFKGQAQRRIWTLDKELATSSLEHIRDLWYLTGSDDWNEDADGNLQYDEAGSVQNLLGGGGNDDSKE